MHTYIQYSMNVLRQGHPGQLVLRASCSRSRTACAWHACSCTGRPDSRRARRCRLGSAALPWGWASLVCAHHIHAQTRTPHTYCAYRHTHARFRRAYTVHTHTPRSGSPAADSLGIPVPVYIISLRRPVSGGSICAARSRPSEVSDWTRRV